MFLPPRLALALAIVACVCDHSIAQPTPDDLPAAKKKHEQAVETAKETLNKAFLARVKDAAQKGDWDAINVLVAEREAFETHGQLPTHPTLTEDVIRYIGARRASASATYLSFQNAIQSAAAKTQLDSAKRLEGEARRFTENESAAVSLGKLTKSASTDDPPEKTPEGKANSTKDRLADFFAEYGKMLSEIANQSTTVKQDEVHRNLVKKIDDRLKGQTWELHCRIEDIRQMPNGRFTITHDAPEEFQIPDQNWSHRRTAEVPLAQQQAVSLKPGDYLIYTGTPRFQCTHPSLGFQSSGGTEFFTVHQSAAGRHFVHNVQLTTVRVKYQKDDSAEKAVPIRKVK